MFAEFEDGENKLIVVAAIWAVLFVFSLSWFTVMGHLFLLHRRKNSHFRSVWRSDYSLKSGLIITFIIASLLALPFILIGMFPELGKDEDMLGFAIFVWLAVFIIGFTCFVWGNLLIRERKSFFCNMWVSESPLISVKQGVATITYRKYGFTSIVKVPLQVPARFKMFTNDDSNIITDLDKESSIFLDITDVYEHFKKIPGQCFSCDNDTHRFYLNCNVDAPLIVVWKQFVLLCREHGS